LSLGSKRKWELAVVHDIALHRIAAQRSALHGWCTSCAARARAAHRAPRAKGAATSTIGPGGNTTV
jgi:hypothetical protein